MTTTGFRAPVLDSNGSPTTTSYDLDDMFVAKQAFKDTGLWQFGYNAIGGPLGQNNLTSYSLPTQVGISSTWKQVGSSRNATLAIKTDGTLWAWGNGQNGRLGLGDTTDRLSPVQVGTDRKSVV